MKDILGNGASVPFVLDLGTSSSAFISAETWARAPAISPRQTVRGIPSRKNTSVAHDMWIWWLCLSSQTWAALGGSWSQLAVTSETQPAGRFQHVAVWDVSSMLIFGGKILLETQEAAADDLWEFSPVTGSSLAKVASCGCEGASNLINDLYSYGLQPNSDGLQPNR